MLASERTAMVLVRTPIFLCVTFSHKTQSIADVNSWNVRRMYTLEGPELEVAPASVGVSAV